MKRDTGRRQPSINQGERPGAIFPSQPWEGTSPADPLILDFQPPELGGNTFLWGHLVFITLLQQPQQTNTHLLELYHVPGTWKYIAFNLPSKCFFCTWRNSAPELPVKQLVQITDSWVSWLECSLGPADSQSLHGAPGDRIISVLYP